MFEPISNKQYETACATLKKIRSILSLRDEMLTNGELATESALPSFAWKTIDLFNYVLNPSYEIVNTWRWHTFPFTGHYLGYALAYAEKGKNTKAPEKLIATYQRLTKGLPDNFIARPPRMLGEIGWEINGGIINDDVLMYQKHLTELYFSGAIEYLSNKGVQRIFEIGSGYGGLAYFFKKIFGKTSYYLTDLVESLAYAAVYLKLTCGLDEENGSIYDGTAPQKLNLTKDGCVFIPNFFAKDLCEKIKFDFIVNTGSFGEMTKEQVEEYAQIIQKTLSDDGILYENNQDTFVPVTQILSKYFKSMTIKRQTRIWAKNTDTLKKVSALSKIKPKSPIRNRSFLILKSLEKFWKNTKL